MRQYRAGVESPRPAFLSSCERWLARGAEEKVSLLEKEFLGQMRNQAVILRSRPTGIAQAEHFAIKDVPVAAPEPGQILVRNTFLSVEPAMRGWIADAGNYSEAAIVRGMDKHAFHATFCDDSVAFKAIKTMSTVPCFTARNRSQSTSHHARQPEECIL